MEGYYYVTPSTPADGDADTFGSRTSALLLILRRCKYSNNFRYVVLQI